MRRMNPGGMLFGALCCALLVETASAQAMRSESRARALPRNEFAMGIDQWQFTPDSGDPRGGTTRWGVMLLSRGSLLGQWNLAETDGALLIGDYIETGVGFYGATRSLSAREQPQIRLPFQYGVQLGKLTTGGAQLVARVGLAAGIGGTAYRGPFIGARVKRRSLGLESTHTIASGASVTSAMFRWYPSTSQERFNIALRYELQTYDPSGIYSLTKGSTERSLMLLFSAER
jgi:hypothetical protein